MVSFRISGDQLNHVESQGQGHLGLKSPSIIHCYRVIVNSDRNPRIGKSLEYYRLVRRCTVGGFTTLVRLDSGINTIEVVARLP